MHFTGPATRPRLSRTPPCRSTCPQRVSKPGWKLLLHLSELSDQAPRLQCKHEKFHPTYKQHYAYADIGAPYRATDARRRTRQSPRKKFLGMPLEEPSGALGSQRYRETPSGIETSTTPDHPLVLPRWQWRGTRQTRAACSNKDWLRPATWTTNGRPGSGALGRQPNWLRRCFPKLEWHGDADLQGRVQTAGVGVRRARQALVRWQATECSRYAELRRPDKRHVANEQTDPEHGGLSRYKLTCAIFPMAITKGID